MLGHFSVAILCLLKISENYKNTIVHKPLETQLNLWHQDDEIFFC